MSEAFLINPAPEVEDLQIHPAGNMLLIELIDGDKTEGGIEIPEQYRESHFPKWRVLAVGPGRLGMGGVWEEVKFKVGDIVIFAPERGQVFRMTFLGDKKRLLTADAIIATVGM